MMHGQHLMIGAPPHFRFGSPWSAVSGGHIAHSMT